MASEPQPMAQSLSRHGDMERGTTSPDLRSENMDGEYYITSRQKILSGTSPLIFQMQLATI